MSTTKSQGTPRIGVYAGSFDPFTNGHVDIATRASKLVDKLIIAIGVNPAKKGFFTVEERVSIIASTMDTLPNVEILSYQGLLVDFCQQQQATCIIRGLRNAQDFAFEANLGRANRHLSPDLETVLLLSNTESIFVSSSLMREIVLNGGSVAGLVPDVAVSLFEEKMQKFQP